MADFQFGFKPTVWLHSARRLLCHSKRSSSATPTDAELANLHINIKPCEKSQLHGLQNIGVIREFILAPKWNTRMHLALMGLTYDSKVLIRYQSRYTSSLLYNSVLDLTKHSPTNLPHVKGQTCIDEDTYSGGIDLTLNVAIPDENDRTAQYLGAVIRRRTQPESIPTAAELYSILSLASKFRDQRTHTAVIKVKLFVAYSCWMQVLTATAPLSYIMSIVEGRANIEGSLEISESPWFNMRSLDGREQILLDAFEPITLDEHERIPEIFLNLGPLPEIRAFPETRTLPEIRTLLQIPESSKRKADDSNREAVKKQKVASGNSEGSRESTGIDMALWC